MCQQTDWPRHKKECRSRTDSDGSNSKPSSDEDRYERDRVNLSEDTSRSPPVDIHGTVMRRPYVRPTRDPPIIPEPIIVAPPPTTFDASRIRQHFVSDDEDSSDGACGIEFASHACMNPTKVWGANRTTPLYDSNIKISDWTFVKTIGSGTYGTVTIRETPTGNTVAFKTIQFSTQAGLPELPDSVSREFEIRNLNHPGVVGICHVQIEEVVPIPAIHIVMDVANTNLLDFAASPLARDIRDKPNGLVVFSLLIIDALAYLHDNLILHGDIKPENILVSFERHPRGFAAARPMFADFGLSRGLMYGPLNDNFAYTTSFTPPELFESFVADEYALSFASDIWAVGCTLLEFVTGSTLFYASTHDFQHQRRLVCRQIEKMLGEAHPADIRAIRASDATRGKTLFRPGLAAGRSPQLTIKLDKLRPKYGNDFPDLLGDMLRWNPLDRPTALAARNHRCFARMLAQAPPTYKMFDYLGYTEPPRHEPLVFAPPLYVQAASVIARFDDMSLRRSPPDVLTPEMARTIATINGCLVRIIAATTADYITIGFCSHAICSWYIRTNPPDNPLLQPTQTNAVPWMIAVACACHRLGFKHLSSQSLYAFSDYNRIFPMSVLSISDIVIQERKIIQALDFDITMPSAFDYMLQYFRMNNMSGRINRAVGAMILRILQCDTNHALYRQSYLARMATYLLYHPIYPSSDPQFLDISSQTQNRAAAYIRTIKSHAARALSCLDTFLKSPTPPISMNLGIPKVGPNDVQRGLTRLLVHHSSMKE
jgi:serine/threonine protein kinase